VDPATITKSIGGVALLTCTMILALTGKIDGQTAMTSITTLGSVFFGAVALTSVGKAIMARKSTSTTEQGVSK
jgi:hypothetical protein